ncbi:hypothetical protein [Variovorax sp. JS1663]|uniref:hypothetical protein n=1 Tax=Variovorax sp. JS1663 TaxID=1851577 RepID=UPI000B3426CE|nr:hypothetical protein [Variovorax sp. JS1663]OUL98353.1 hypothetical protein A8M77_31930 [Variovorax sp. JS1663]
MVREEHFTGLTCRFAAGGLAFSEWIGAAEREAECLDLGDTFGEVAERLKPIASRAPLQVVVNPREPSVSELRRILRAGQKADLPREAIAVDHGLGRRYIRRWGVEPPSGVYAEGQPLVVVGFFDGVPIGYVGMQMVALRISDLRQVTALCKLALIYVLPRWRGQGFSMDFSVACSWIAQDVVSAAYRAMPAGWRLEAVLTADYESEGGERVALQVGEGMQYRLDVLRESGPRKSVIVGGVEMDAGY